MLRSFTMPPTETSVITENISIQEFTPPDEILFREVNGKKIKRKLVGINGFWYDVTEFIQRHPGGPIIEKFIGKDATTVFKAYNHIDIRKFRKPVGTYETPLKHAADRDFEKLITDLKEKGFYVTNPWFYVGKITFALTLMFSAWSCVLFFDHWLIHYMGAVSMAFSWHQFGFIMHEFMHGQVWRVWKVDRFFALIFGTVWLGFSAHWWQDEHVLHHGLTNVVDVNDPWVDPQMWEVTWAQHPKLFPLYQRAIQWVLIKIQHITFIPFVVGIGRFEIVQDSTRRERRWYEILSLTLHWVWLIWLLSHLPTWNEIVTFYLIASFVEGIFHFQVQSNMNIDCPWWLDWFYGGLQFHIEHHLFPKMARNKLREAASFVRPICEKHGIEYIQVPFSTALWMTLKHLKTVGKHFKLDPR